MNELANIDPVVSESDTAAAINVSTSTLRRMHTRGEGPRRLQLSRRRIGYRLRDIENWLTIEAAKPATGLSDDISIESASRSPAEDR
jgi:predicted DNA-binding transcriptional regulator AlpA